MQPMSDMHQGAPAPKRFGLFHALGGLLFLGTMLGLSFGDFEPSSGLQAFITPEVVTVQTPTTIRLSFVVQAEKMTIGGGLKVRLSKGFGRPQNQSPDLPNYVAAYSSDPRAKFSIAQIERVDGQVPWPTDNNAWVVTVLLQEHELQYGDSIHVVFGAASTGRVSPPSSAYADTILMACDLGATGVYQTFSPNPTIKILPRSPYRIAGYLPSRIVIGQTTNLKITILDEYNNLALPFTGIVELTATNGVANFPAQVEFMPADSSRKTVEVNFQTPGVHDLQLRVPANGPDSLWQVHTNPVEVTGTPSPWQIYWGDLHSHSCFSHDAYGRNTFVKARDVAGLDFYALTDHASYYFKRNAGLTPPEWEAVKQDVVRYHQPGKFVTIPAYEFGAKAPSGHHNIYFNAHDELVRFIPLLREEDYGQVQKVWAIKDNVLPPGVAMLTVPHHTGIIWNELAEEGASPLVSFGLGFSDPRLRPLIEIYSAHGLSEYYNPGHGLSYKSLDRSGSKGVSNGPHYAQDAWAAGEFLGTIASSDDHSGRPGLPFCGLTAVLATELTRDGIFDALKKRRTYGTTGQRILLHFEIDGHMMGATIVRKTPHHPKIDVAVHGTDDLDYVEVLCWNKRRGQFANGHPVFATLYRERGNGKQAAFQVVDSSYSGSSIYYVRAKQKNNITYPQQFISREVWAWSSPIWMEETPSLDTSETKAVPRHLELPPNYPNPFKRVTIMRYYLPQPGRVKATLYNTLGQLVEVLVDDVASEGWHGFRIANRYLSPGVYFVRLQAAGQVVTQKIVMVK